jgi:hypothetical protein
MVALYGLYTAQPDTSSALSGWGAQAFVITRFLVSTLSRGGAWGPASGFGIEMCGQSDIAGAKVSIVGIVSR